MEHTSVNPLHPIHIGQARNPMLGDALARILQYRGHVVSSHYYIDDVGRQSSVVAYGYAKLGRPKPTEKTDLFVGKIYTVTSCIVEINRLKKVRENAIATHSTDDLVKANKDIDEWMSIAAELKEKYPVLFEALTAQIRPGKTHWRARSHRPPAPLPRRPTSRRRCARIPRVAGDAPHRVEGVAAGKFRHVRLGERDAPLARSVAIVRSSAGAR